MKEIKSFKFLWKHLNSEVDEFKSDISSVVFVILTAPEVINYENLTLATDMW